MEMNYAKPRFFFIYYIFVDSLELIPSISFSACVSTLSRFFSRNRSSHRRCSVRKAVLTNFSKFTGKQLCQYLFFNNVVSDLKVRLKQKYNSRTFHCHIFCFKWMEYLDKKRGLFEVLEPITRMGDLKSTEL